MEMEMEILSAIFGPFRSALLVVSTILKQLFVSH